MADTDETQDQAQAGTPAPTDADARQQPRADTAAPPADGRSFTQAELEAIITKRLARERKSWETEAEDTRRKAEMTEAERLKEAVDAAEKRAAAAAESANARIIRAEAKALLAAAGVKSELIERAIRLLDLSEVAVTDGGDPDPRTIRAEIDALLKDMPQLRGPAAAGVAGGDFSATTAQTPLTDEVIGRMSTDELKRRMPEVEAYYKNKNRRM